MRGKSCGSLKKMDVGRDSELPWGWGVGQDAGGGEAVGGRARLGDCFGKRLGKTVRTQDRIILLGCWPVWRPCGVVREERRVGAHACKVWLRSCSGRWA